jgi:hypothetical protein
VSCIVARSPEATRLPSGLAQALVAGPDDRLGPVGHLQLGEDGRDVVADRLAADHELTSDRGIGPAGRDQVEHLALPGGQLGKGLGRLLVGALGFAAASVALLRQSNDEFDLPSGR